MARLSKSRIMSSLQCLKKVHLEVHRKDLLHYSPRTLANFQLGHDIGDIAIEIYGKGQGEFIPFEGGLGKAERRTRELMGGLFKAPVFEATLSHQDVLIREDVLLPNGDSWDIIEVKASTRLKDEHIPDCAVQAWVHRGAGFDYRSISLAHVDNQFVYAEDGNFEGLLTSMDLTDAVRDLQSSVPIWVDRAKEAVDGPEPEVAVGHHCFSPYECPFVEYCWPMDTEYPVLGLGGAKKKLGELVAQGFEDIRDVPADSLSSESHLRIHQVTQSGSVQILPEAGEFMRELEYPRYYFDFETVGPAIPIWEGTRPYEVLPFQWSCHVEHEDGRVEHIEFLELDGRPPMRACAEKMINEFGTHGPVIIYTSYENTVINGLIERFPDLAAGLEAIQGRLVDIAPPIKQSYYHPDMMGSWSLKAILPTVAADLDYTALEGVHEGTEASNAYLEAIDDETTLERKEEIRLQLLKYCEYDTLAMVRLVEFFSEH